MKKRKIEMRTETQRVYLALDKKTFQRVVEEAKEEGRTISSVISKRLYYSYKEDEEDIQLLKELEEREGEETIPHDKVWAELLENKREMTNKDEFDGFSIELFKDDDGDWFAHFKALPNVSAFGSSPEDALQELKVAWELMKESYASHNESINIEDLRLEAIASIKRLKDERKGEKDD
jgi:predicted RNase H-like HicB family nuclease